MWVQINVLFYTFGVYLLIPINLCVNMYILYGIIIHVDIMCKAGREDPVGPVDAWFVVSGGAVRQPCLQHQVLPVSDAAGQGGVCDREAGPDRPDPG